MVDRPIKKSDREAAEPSQSTENSSGTPADAQQTEARKVPPPVKKADRKDGGASSESGERRDDRSRGGKGKGKGRGRDKDDGPRTPMNPALMRGPKPTPKVDPPEEEAVEESTEATEATDSTETTEATDSTETTEAAETTEATAEAETATEEAKTVAE